jgi:hypothetical protein
VVDHDQLGTRIEHALQQMGAVFVLRVKVVPQNGVGSQVSYHSGLLSVSVNEENMTLVRACLG